MAIWLMNKAPNNERSKRLSKHQSTCRICGKSTHGGALCKSCARLSQEGQKGTGIGKHGENNNHL